MDYNKIQALLDKYWEAQTSIEEEKILKNYFNQSDIDTRLKEFQPLFQHFELEKEVSVSDGFEDRLLSQISEKPDTKVIQLKSWYYRIASAAAILLICFTAYFLQQYEPMQPSKKGATVIVLDDAENAEEAYAKVKAALMIVSAKMNKGNQATKQSIGKLNVLQKIK